LICASIDVIIQAARLRDGSRASRTSRGDGHGRRYIITQDLFPLRMVGEDANGNIIGRHRSTRHRTAALLGSRTILRAKRSGLPQHSMPLKSSPTSKRNHPMQALALAFLATTTVGVWHGYFSILHFRESERPSIAGGGREVGAGRSSGR